MSYIKQGFVSGQTLKAEHLNYIENGIEAIANAANNSGGQAIIDVLELPTENINEGAFYRLMSAKFVSNQYYAVDDWTCYYVNELPSVGEPVSTDMVNITGYYNVQDGEVYGYADSMISAVGGIPVGWYPIGVLGQAFDVDWGGVIMDADEIDDSAKVLLSKDFYIYQDGWCKLPFACEKAPKFDITWDGVIGDRFALDMSMLGYDAGTYFVKVSDEVLAAEEFVGGSYKYYLNDDDAHYEYEIESHMFDHDSYSGAFTIQEWVVVVHSEEELTAALGVPAGYITNGVYYLLVEGVNHLARLTTPARITKIDEKYLPDMSVDINSLGLSSVAISGNYNDLYNCPTIYTDVIRYGATQYLSPEHKTIARRNIDVYSKSEVDDSKLGLNYDTININIDVNKSLYSICYGDGKFVAVGYSSAFYSEDGISWKESTLPVSHYWNAVCYGNGKFVVMTDGNGSSSKYVLYSEDGITWNSTSISDGSCYDVCYGDGKFVAIYYKYGEEFRRIMSSTNGISWTNNMQISSRINANSICYGDGKFVVMGQGTALYSEDGISWNEIALPVQLVASSICYGDGKFVAVGEPQNSNSCVLYSEDCINWNEASFPVDVCCYDVCYGDGKFVAVGSNYYDGSDYNATFYSEDGISWKEYALPVDTGLLSICYGDGKFVTVGFKRKDGGNILYSKDGIAWTNQYTYPTFISNSNNDVTAKVAEFIKPHLNLTASDIGTIEGIPIFLTSPNGSRYKLTVDDSGNLTANAIVETP